MIKINLATRKQAVTSDNAPNGMNMGAITGLFNGAKNVNFEGLKEMPLKRVGLLIAFIVISNYIFEDYKDSEVQKLEAIVIKGRDEQTKLTTELAKTKGYEQIKKSLEADELTLRTKIDVIQKLLSDRQTPPKMMVTLSGSIPPDVWLKKFKVDEKEVTFQGSSLGFNAVSDFMKNLNESAYFSDVRLTGTKQERDEAGLETAGFELVAKRR